CRPLLRDVISSAERAAQLTSQMLAYAGKGGFFVTLVDIGQVITQTLELLRASIPERVELRAEVEPSAPPVKADPAQSLQIVTNLVINGAESIPEGSLGTVTITAAKHSIDRAYSDDGGEIAAGSYIRIQVRDTGSGMDDGVRARIFDPFFTTKFVGRGLGLAAVLGAVGSQKGVIRVDSEPGRGRSFTVLLPAASVEVHQ